MADMIECSGACAPPLHIGPQTCEERAEARRYAREAFVHSDPHDGEISRGGKKHDLESARERAKAALDAGADGKALSAAPLGPVYTPAANAVPFLTQLIAQENYPDDIAPMARRAAEASGHYNAVPTSRVSYDGPQIAFDILA